MTPLENANPDHDMLEDGDLEYTPGAISRTASKGKKDKVMRKKTSVGTAGSTSSSPKKTVASRKVEEKKEARTDPTTWRASTVSKDSTVRIARQDQE